MKKREIISKQKLTESINKVNDRTPMVFYLTMFIFVVSCVTGAILMALYTLLNELGVIGELNLYLVILLFLVCSIAISTSLVRGLGNKIIFRSLRRITEFSNSIAEGDFSKRLTPRVKRSLPISAKALTTWRISSAGTSSLRGTSSPMYRISSVHRLQLSSVMLSFFRIRLCPNPSVGNTSPLSRKRQRHFPSS